MCPARYFDTLQCRSPEFENPVRARGVGAVLLPDGSNKNWTRGGNWWDANEQDQVFTDFQNWPPSMLDLPVVGPAWYHACFHVGRTLESYRTEIEVGWTPRTPGTEPAYAGRGIGTALCEESIRWARE